MTRELSVHPKSSVNYTQTDSKIAEIGVHGVHV